MPSTPTTPEKPIPATRRDLGPPAVSAEAARAAKGVPREAPAAARVSLIVKAGEGFKSVPLSPARTLSVVNFEARASEPALDGVIGLSFGPASSFNDLATAVRFAPPKPGQEKGVIDVRDGDSYRADLEYPWEPGEVYWIRMVTDVLSHTYSVYVNVGGFNQETIRLARGYDFRPTQSGAKILDTLSAIVDGPSGELSIHTIIDAAPSSVAYSREGSFAVAPLPGDHALVSDRVATTWKLDASGQVLGQVARGGEVAADEAGNVYVATASSGQLAIHAFTPQLAPRWSRVDPVEPSATVRAISADAAGVSIALATATQGVASIWRYPADGGVGTPVHGGGTIAALGRDRFAVATTWEGGVSISLYHLDGCRCWCRSFPNKVWALVMTLGLDGRVVLGGYFFAPINFGGPTLEPVPHEFKIDSYAVALARADGSHVFTTRIPTSVLTGAGANAGRLVIAGEDWVTPIFPHLWQLDPAGNVVGSEPGTGFDYEEWGRSGQVAVGASNRIYWERFMVWPGPPIRPDPSTLAFPYLLALVP